MTNLDGYGTGWQDHHVVLKDGKVYDAFTGPTGETIEQFKKRWKDVNNILIWPF